MKASHNDDQPARVSHRCAIAGCQLAGALSVGGSWHCAYHFGCTASEVPKVSAVLTQLRPLVDEINEAQRMLNDSDVDGNTLAAQCDVALQRLAPLGYTADVLQEFATVELGRRRDLRALVHALRCYIGAEVVEVRAGMRTRRREDLASAGSRRIAA